MRLSPLLRSPLRLLSVEEAASDLSSLRGQLLEAPLLPGAWLRLLLPGSAAHVSLHSGPAGRVSVAAEGEAGPGLRLSASAEGHLTLALAAGGALSRLRVWLPDRFCSVALAGGGAASLDRLTEAEARLCVRGPLLLGALRCSHLQLRSRGGAVRADALQGERVGVDSGGGALRLRRLLGRRVALLSRGGELRVDSVFAERLRLSSGGGAVELGALRVGAAARLCSSGGPLRLSALDGEPGAALEARSGGGLLSCGLEAAAERMARIRLACVPAALRLSLPPGWRAPPRLAGGGAAPLPPPRAPEAGRKAVAAAPSARQAWIEAAALGGDAVCLEVEAGGVEVSERSWIEGALGARARGLAEAGARL